MLCATRLRRAHDNALALTPLRRPAPAQTPPTAPGISADTAVPHAAEGAVTRSGVKPRYRGKAWQLQQLATVRERFTAIYAKNQNRVLCRRIKCNRSLVAAWLSGRVPLHGLQALLAVVEADLVVLRGLQADLRKLVADREAEPKRLGGMFRVKDWGDGLPPHAKVHRGGGQGRKRLVVGEDGSTESVFVGKAEPQKVNNDLPPATPATEQS